MFPRLLEGSVQTEDISLRKCGEVVFKPLCRKARLSSHQCSPLLSAQRLLRMRTCRILLPPCLLPCSLHQSRIIAPIGRWAVLLISNASTQGKLLLLGRHGIFGKVIPSHGSLWGSPSSADSRLAEGEHCPPKTSDYSTSPVESGSSPLTTRGVCWGSGQRLVPPTLLTPPCVLAACFGP